MFNTYNPYLGMKYNPRTNEIKMTKKNFLTFIAWWNELDEEGKEKALSVFNYFTRERKKV